MKNNLSRILILASLNLTIGLASSAGIAAKKHIAGIKYESISRGDWCFSEELRSSSRDSKGSTVYLELSWKGGGDCDDSDRADLALTQDNNLVIENVAPGRITGAPDLNFASPISTMQMVRQSADGSTNQWPLKVLSSGTITVPPSTDRKKLAVGGLPFSSTNERQIILTLPDDIQKLVNEAISAGYRTIISIRSPDGGVIVTNMPRPN